MSSSRPVYADVLKRIGSVGVTYIELMDEASRLVIIDFPTRIALNNNRTFIYDLIAEGLNDKDKDIYFRSNNSVGRQNKNEEEADLALKRIPIVKVLQRLFGLLDNAMFGCKLFIFFILFIKSNIFYISITCIS